MAGLNTADARLGALLYDMGFMVDFAERFPDAKPREWRVEVKALSHDAGGKVYEAILQVANQKKVFRDEHALRIVMALQDKNLMGVYVGDVHVFTEAEMFRLGLLPDLPCETLHVGGTSVTSVSDVALDAASAIEARHPEAELVEFQYAPPLTDEQRLMRLEAIVDHLVSRVDELSQREGLPPYLLRSVGD